MLPLCHLISALSPDVELWACRDTATTEPMEGSCSRKGQKRRGSAVARKGVGPVRCELMASADREVQWHNPTFMINVLVYCYKIILVTVHTISLLYLCQGLIYLLLDSVHHICMCVP